MTHFLFGYTNYPERSIRKLHNCLGELWSLLVALAASYEEQRGVAGLLDVISSEGNYSRIWGEMRQKRVK